MKNRLLLIVLFCSFLAFSQQRTEVVLNWADNVKTSVGNTPVVIPVFDAQYMLYVSSTQQLNFSANLTTVGAIDPASLQISNVVYESISREQLGELSTALPSAINATIKSVKARDSWSAVLKLSPIIKEGIGYKRVKSFAYSYSLSNLQYKTSAAAAVSNSVLASGSWYRFYVQKSGVYKLTRSFLQQLGLDVNADPRTIKVYGNGGRMLPMLNSAYYPADLTENSVKFIGEEDGNFGNSDYILFYAEGVDNWNTDSGTHINLYADKSYYYVTAGNGSGKRIQEAAQPTASAAVTVTTFDEYQYHETDLINIARLGRKWHGEAFNINNEQEFKFTVPDIVTTEPVTITVSAAATSSAASSMVVTANSAPIATLSFNKLVEHILGQEDIKSGTFNAAGSAISVKLAYNNSGNPSANAWLDYIVLRAKRNLKGNGTQFRFRYNDARNTVGTVQYTLSNASGISEVWDVTDIYNVSKITNQGNQAGFTFKSAYPGEAREYITVTTSDYYTPLRDSKTRVVNQDIKGTIFKNAQGQFQDVDYIIVTPASLNSSAEKLANMHRAQSGLNVKVVNLENIYEEFSAGKQDIGAIRNFVKYVYNNANSAAGRIKYLNLFGDASFDYKNRIPNNTNVVPTVHCFVNGPTTSNYSEVVTYVTDDFFGLMDDNEGVMNLNPAYGLDIAVGRMLVNNKTQADEMVNKAIIYKGADSYGRWRNEYLMISDDADASSDTEFVETVEEVADSINTYRPFVNIRKVYADSYVQQSSAGGQRYPDAKEQIVRYINNGTAVVNYLGHGGENGMAAERIFEITDARGLTNANRYSLFITATCELTKFDNPYVPTVGEDLYWNANGGGIAMISTTRAIFIDSAFEFNKQLSSYLYAYANGVQNEYPTMAEALRLAKAGNVSNQFVTCVSFIGDPALKLAVAKPQIVLTKINDKPVTGATDVLQSLAYVKLTGNVVDESGAVLSSYTGELEASVFDKAIQRITLNNDGQDKQRPFAVLGETIYRGNASINNGQFEFGFVVPRDIRIPVGDGRVSFYSRRANVLEDRTGYNSTIKIGGVNLNAEADTTPPTVKLYMNDESFVSGGLTNASPILLAYLEDAHGINTASGIGHDIIGILDGDETNEFLMNDYYQTNTDDYKKGTLRFPFAGLEKGMHTLTFKAWDVYNNLVTAEIQFVVSGDDALILEKVLNYPNPFVNYTEFWFNHNRPFEPLDVQVQIFTVTGKIVKTINQTVTTDGFLSRDIKWDGRDDFGDKIGKGVYIYKLTVKSSTTNKKAEKFEKLVLL